MTLNKRPSKWPRAVLCPASLIEPEVVIDAPGEPARIGTKVHSLIEQFIIGKKPLQSLHSEALADSSGDVAELFDAAVYAWEHSIAPLFPELSPEHKLPASEWVDGGTTDGLAAHTDWLAIVDWKTARKESDAWPQVVAYLHNAIKQYGERPTYYGAIVWLRVGVVEIREFTPAEISDYTTLFKSTVAAATRTKPVHSPSVDSCRYCPRAHECGARTTYIKNSFAIFDGEPTKKSAHEVYAKAGIVGDAIERAKTSVKMLVGESPESVPSLRLVDVSRETIDAPTAFRVLRERGYDSNIFDNTADISKKALERALRDDPRGDETMRAIRDAGAIRISTHTQIKEAKK